MFSLRTIITFSGLRNVWFAVPFTMTLETSVAATVMRFMHVSMSPIKKLMVTFVMMMMVTMMMEVIRVAVVIWPMESAKRWHRKMEVKMWWLWWWWRW